jgi:hypothetical protein
MKEIVYTFGEQKKVLRFNESGAVTVNAGSIALSECAEKIAREENMSFGEALKKARRALAERAEASGRKPDFDSRYVVIEQSETLRFAEDGRRRSPTAIEALERAARLGFSTVAF